MSNESNEKVMEEVDVKVKRTVKEEMKETKQVLK